MSNDNSVPALDGQKRTGKVPPLLVVAVVLSLLIAVGAVLYAVSVNRDVDERIINTETSISAINSSFAQRNEGFRQFVDETLIEFLGPLISHLPQQEIDLTGQGWQDLGHGLRIVDISVSEHLTGVKVTGRLVNVLSVSQSRISFMIKIGDSGQTFEVVESIAPGYGALFEVYVPDVPLSSSNKATMTYVQSYMSRKNQ